MSLRSRPSIYRRSPIWAPLALAIAAAFSAPAQADNLVELYGAARAFDATYLAARAQAESAIHRAAISDALRLPTVDLRAAATRTELDPPPGNISPNGERVSGDTVGATVEGRQPLFNRSNGVTIDQAQKALESARSDLDTAEQDLIVRVAQAYFDVLAAQDTLGFTSTSRKAISEQLASAKRNFEVGTATITDTREAQARFDLATAQEIAAENDLRSKRIVLDQLVGRSGVKPDPLIVPVVLPPVLPNDAEQWVNSAWGVHPSIRRAQLAVDIARLETEKAKAGHLPTLDLVGTLGRERGDGRAVNIEGTTTTGTLGVEFRLPLFAGFAVQNRVKETLVLEEKSRNDLEASRRGVATSTRQAFFGVQSGQAQVKALEAAEVSSKLALEATQLGYRVGIRVNIDVLNAQTQLFQTQRDLAGSRYDVLLGDLRLRQAAGLLRPEDLAATNRLFTR
jgi:outer membrane protein